MLKITPFVCNEHTCLLPQIAILRLCLPSNFTSISLKSYLLRRRWINTNVQKTIWRIGVNRNNSVLPVRFDSNIVIAPVGRCRTNNKTPNPIPAFEKPRLASAGKIATNSIATAMKKQIKYFQKGISEVLIAGNVVLRNSFELHLLQMFSDGMHTRLHFLHFLFI